MSEVSCVRGLLCQRSLVSEVSCVRGLLCQRSLVSEVSCVRGLLCQRSLVSEVSCVRGLLCRDSLRSKSSEEHFTHYGRVQAGATREKSTPIGHFAMGLLEAHVGECH